MARLTSNIFLFNGTIATTATLGSIYLKALQASQNGLTLLRSYFLTKCVPQSWQYLICSTIFTEKSPYFENMSQYLVPLYNFKV
ncbi:uncharacterized protein METZ01_LOCUS50339 [marine metagenome]|uniref:Uncharacterized protein n=1 Tax=marine metagenome TaxID=408172 RepID=A0A381S052_9ZZZZ